VPAHEDVIAVYDECKHYRLMTREICGPDQYIEQLNFWTRSEIEQFGHALRLSSSSTLLDLGCGLGGQHACGRAFLKLG
jgi:cyclopropane fatty-acyl-phospholipid synthase-like methyltransferase